MEQIIDLLKKMFQANTVPTPQVQGSIESTPSVSFGYGSRDNFTVNIPTSKAKVPTLSYGATDTQFSREILAQVQNQNANRLWAHPKYKGFGRCHDA